MDYYLIPCRTLTYAQRTQAALTRSGVRACLTRSPGAITDNGCGYAVKLRGRALEAALSVLRSVGLAPCRVFATEDGACYREVAL